MHIVINAVDDTGRAATVTIESHEDESITLQARGNFNVAQAALETIADLNDGDITSVVATKTDGTREVIR